MRDILKYQDAISLKLDFIGFLIGVSMYSTPQIEALLVVLQQDFESVRHREEPHAVRFYEAALQFIRDELEDRKEKP